MRTFPFSAVVGSDDMRLALVLTTVSPAIGGVLVRGEKGTAKSTTVRALAELLPAQRIIDGCRFGCDPVAPDPRCPDGPHDADEPTGTRPARLVELPVGATEDRVIGSLDLEQALGAGRVRYEPGLLAEANRGLLYVDEVNLLHDHLVDLLLDAAAMGRNTVERDGVSISHAARIVLVGTMNPEEGELRPQLLDRFGLTVEVAAPRDPQLRAEVVRRRLAYDADPEAFAAAYDTEQQATRARLTAARELLDHVTLGDRALLKIAEICAAFEVDGMRADIVTARTAAAHAAWNGRDRVTKEDLRAAARLALPHRRRRNPFDAPGLDEDLLDRLLDDLDDDPDPDDRPDDPAPQPDDTLPDETGSAGSDTSSADPAPDSPTPPAARRDTGTDGTGSGPADADPATDPTAHSTEDDPGRPSDPAPTMLFATAGRPYRTRRLEARGIGAGEAGRRSRARTAQGRAVGAGDEGRTLHLPATIRAAAPHQATRGRSTGALRLAPSDLRRTVAEGRESNLVLLVVDASGSMAARRRMEAVKTAVLSLLLDAYQRRDKVGLVTFRGAEATLVLPPTSSVDAAARRLDELPAGGRTPLAEGLATAAEVLRRERIRDPRRRPLLVVLTDGRATSGPDALPRARRVAEFLSGYDAVVIDCETGRFRLGLAGRLAAAMGADLVELGEIGRDQVSAAGRTIVTTVQDRLPDPRRKAA
ncbi:putative cobaltochelatase [Raineyella sp. LH-20]|uniref:putative cobaltochelatase n=1 Tax=Raineyella sp. LH-20 TaxID=3081204 RepID=UPI0029558008|nr:putative cobaltochelatase [Raineyella sp. LH-20]WOP19785.1 putative cobaltochelatase [Raineyella sp. LH-20]